jgi:hypothetical protein
MGAQEFLVLGSQKLIALRDKIKCVSDLLPEPRSRSGYFFFENVFYDDLRYPDNICYSKYALLFRVVCVCVCRAMRVLRVTCAVG